MLVHSQDDCLLTRHSAFSENIDYMAKTHISNFHLHLCWRENNSLSGTRLQDDISQTIPSSDSRRLENIAWRRLYKQIWHLDEVSPSIINWNKNQDVTWLYGPKYHCTSPFDNVPLTKANLSKLAGDDLESGDEVSSVFSARSMSFDDSSSVESLDEDEDMDLKSALKSRRHPFVGERKNKKKVKFNYIVNSREFMNGLSFDYHFLDTSCL